MTAQQISSRTLYVSDLDRTLLGAGGILSDESLRLLNSCTDEGALFTYATARSPSSAEKATAGLRATLPTITYGGTMLTDPETGNPTEVCVLPVDIVATAFAEAEAHPRIAPLACIYEDGRDWVRWDPSRVTPGVDAFLSQHRGDPRLRPLTAEDPLNRENVHYMSVLATRDELIAYRHAVRECLGRTAHFISEYAGTPGLSWLEFHNQSGTKAVAVKRLRALSGADRLVVFGDNHNDVPMFEIADESYAVQNAVPELISIASGTIGHHDSDAVARFIAEDFGRTLQ